MRKSDGSPQHLCQYSVALLGLVLLLVLLVCSMYMRIKIRKTCYHINFVFCSVASPFWNVSTTYIICKHFSLMENGIDRSKQVDVVLRILRKMFSALASRTYNITDHNSHTIYMNHRYTSVPVCWQFISSSFLFFVIIQNNNNSIISRC